PLERIDDGIARDLDLLDGDPLVEEVAARPVRRREVPLRERRRDLAVELFRKGCVSAVRAETSLDVADGDARVEGGERSREGGGGIALDQHRGGTRGGQYRRQAFEDARGYLAGHLAIAHDVEPVVGLDTEELEDLVEHLPVLVRDAHRGPEPRLGRQRPQDGRHLDRLGARAEDCEDRAGHVVTRNGWYRCAPRRVPSAGDRARARGPGR